MDNKQLLNLILGFKSIVIPFLTEKYKQYMLKKARTSLKLTTIILLCRYSGKTEFVKSNTIDDHVLLLDFDNLLTTNTEYNNIVMNSNSDNIMLLPLKYKLYSEIRTNFKNKSIVILSSDKLLTDYLIENEKNINLISLLPTTKYYSNILVNLNEEQKNIFINSYKNLENNKNVKYFENQFELNNLVLNYFI
jgi:hypothetical protein